MKLFLLLPLSVFVDLSQAEQSVLASFETEDDEKVREDRWTQAMERIENSAALPGTNVVMFQTSEGMMFITGNARYVIRGELLDKWHDVTVETVDDLVSLSDQTPLHIVEGMTEDLNSVTWGNGTKSAYLFIDPLATNTPKFLQQARNLTSEYSFKVIFLLGNQGGAMDAYSLIECLSEEKRIELLVAISNNTASEIKFKDSCRPQSLPKAMIASQMLNCNYSAPSK